MRRAADEREWTVKLWRRHLALHEPSADLCRCEQQPGVQELEPDKITNMIEIAAGD